MRDISRFTGHTLGEPSALDRRVKILKERAKLSRLSEGEETGISPNGTAADRRGLRFDEGMAYRTSVPTMK
jgi:hypothetical protein